MRPQALIAIALIGFIVVGCSRTAPIYNVSEAPIPPSAQPSAATNKGWIVMKDDSCRLILKLDISRHSALVRVDYSPTTYNITYEDSVLLRYDGSNIHPNYNAWVKVLQNEIDRRLAEWMLANRRASPGSGGARATC